jgi:hypothetical protein
MPYAPKWEQQEREMDLDPSREACRLGLIEVEVLYNQWATVFVNRLSKIKSL